MRVWRTIVLFSLICWQLAFLEPVHSKLLITSTPGANGTIALSFKVVPNADMKINHEAPWKLTITSPGALNLTNGGEPYENKNFDQSLPGFTVTSGALGAKSGKFTYQLKSYICSADKSTCYPEVHKGEYAWKLDQK